ncbi:sulfotransferase [Aureococcus anophagefferens]|nr:sulfotransferase [Aureococcus anophagefferens]
MLAAALRRVKPGNGLLSWAPTVVCTGLGLGAIVDLDHRENPTNLAKKPAYYEASGAAAFKALTARDDDVFVASYPKCGTSFGHGIVYALLRMDDDGACGDDGECGGRGQVYPDGVAAKRGDVERRAAFGAWSFEDLSAQRAPRLFTSHSKADALPATLALRGRYAARRPKDCLVSGFFFVRGLDAKPLYWLRRRYHDLDSYFETFLERDGGGTYGDWWSWHSDAAALAEDLGPERALVVFYEDFHRDFDAAAAALAAFLGVSLTPGGSAALRRRTAMGDDAGATVPTARLGRVGDHRRPPGAPLRLDRPSRRGAAPRAARARARLRAAAAEAGNNSTEAHFGIKKPLRRTVEEGGRGDLVDAELVGDLVRVAPRHGQPAAPERVDERALGAAALADLADDVGHGAPHERRQQIRERVVDVGVRREDEVRPDDAVKGPQRSRRGPVELRDADGAEENAARFAALR